MSFLIRHHRPSKRVGLRTGIVADDLTGAADTGVQFAKAGWRTYVLSPPVFIEKAEIGETRREFASVPVLVINTQSRNISSQEAYRRARIAFSVLLDRELLYKKVDSSLRGNIGTEIDAAMDATGRREAIFSAAYPAYHRVTVEGRHYIGSEALDMTEVCRDPKAPVCDSQVSRILARQSMRRIAHIENLGFAGDLTGLAALLTGSHRAGNQILSCDAATDQDLESLARIALDSKRVPLLVGSAGLAAQVARLLPADGAFGVQAPGRSNGEGAVWVVSGSASAKNEEQLRYLENQPGARRVSVTEEVIRKYSNSTGEGLHDPLRQCGQPGDDARVVLLAIQMEATGRQDPGRVSSLFTGFGQLAAELLRLYRSRISGLVLSGGETAEMILGNLGANGIWLINEVQPGVPLGIVAGGELDGMPVITKAGALGREDTLATCARGLAKDRPGAVRA